MNHPFGDYLLNLERPARYIGGEFNAVRKPLDKVVLHIGLLYPEIYEIGMSNLGLKIIYHIFNSHPDVYAERIFLPWIDAIEYMKEREIPLFTLESYTPVRNLDMLGISLHTELNYTNLLMALDLSHIPLLREERVNGKYPLVVVGGPSSFNPLPLEPFVDFFVVGEGEEVVKKLIPYLLDYKRGRLSISEFYSEIAKLEGIYIPGVSKKAKRAVAYFNTEDFPVDQIVPTTEIVHHRYVVEVMRGCTRGCRFCQGGFNYRPLRLREPEEVLKIVNDGLRKTGFDEVGLLAFSISDYPYLSELIRAFKERFENTHISLPSLPIDSLDESLLVEFEELRRFGITLAPEVASEKLRKVINKNVPLESIFRTLDIALKFNFRHVKLYLMIGVPGETAEDLEEMVKFLKELSIRYRKIEFNASISPFVPRPHTPFQFARQETPDEIYSKIDYLRKSTKSLRNFTLTFHDPKMSLIEGIFGRGDSALSSVLLDAYKEGAIFDSRSEFFDYNKYLKAFEKNGIDPFKYTRRRDPSEQLPWEIIDTGVYPKYLRNEFFKSQEITYTADCMARGCQGCGVWIKEGYELCKTGIKKVERVQLSGRPMQEKIPAKTSGYLLTYKVRDMSRFISQRDLTKVIVNILRACGVKLKYSQGYVPHPRISMPNPLPLGVESEEEYFYFEAETVESFNDLISRLNLRTIPGLEFLSIIPVDKKPDWSRFSIARFKLEKDGESEEFTVDLSQNSLYKVLKEKFGIERSELNSVRIKKVAVLK